MILVVAMATEVAIKIFKIIFLVLSGNDHSVKVSSNSEVGPGTALWEFFGFLRELVLRYPHYQHCRFFCKRSFPNLSSFHVILGTKFNSKRFWN